MHAAGSERPVRCAGRLGCTCRTSSGWSPFPPSDRPLSSYPNRRCLRGRLSQLPVGLGLRPGSPDCPAPAEPPASGPGRAGPSSTSFLLLLTSPLHCPTLWLFPPLEGPSLNCASVSLQVLMRMFPSGLSREPLLSRGHCCPWPGGSSLHRNPSALGLQIVIGSTYLDGAPSPIACAFWVGLASDSPALHLFSFSF